MLEPTEKPQQGAAAEIAERLGHSRRQRIRLFFHANPTAAPTIVLVLTVLAFYLLNGARFLAPFNISLILQQSMVVGTLAIAQTLIILTKGIDLSVGGIMVLCSTASGQLAVTSGVPPTIAFLGGLLTGVVAGGINGMLVTRFRLPPFITTLGTWNAFFALNLWLSGGQSIRSRDLADNAPILQWTGRPLTIFGTAVPYGVILMLAMFLVVWFMLTWTAWGRRVTAVGDDIEAARLVGIRTDRVLMSVYVLGGAICAVAGWMLIGRIGAASPQAGQMANLESISAVVIGGTSLFGGRGSVVGTLLGALTVGVFANGLALAGVDVLWRNFAIGLLIILAVATDQAIRRPAT